MLIYRGIVASEGLAIGYIWRLIHRDIDTIPGVCEARDPELECSKISRALERYREQLDRLRENLPEETELLEAYGLIAETIAQEAMDLVRSSNMCGELAVKKIYERYSEILKRGGGLISLREADLRGIASELIKSMLGRGGEAYPRAVSEAVILAHEISPTTLLEVLEKGSVRAIVTRAGGVTSHAAIIARNNGIPYVISPNIDLDSIVEGSLAIVDAFEGKVIVEPAEDMLARYRALMEEYRSLREAVRAGSLEKARTLDGHEIQVLCNAGGLEEARLAAGSGCDGLGLFRVEFLYMGREPPGEEALYNVFTKTAGFFHERVVVIRAPDIGADKKLPYLDIREDNPFLGLRGIRLLLAYRDEIFKPFLRAFLRASAAHRNLRLMLPMISRVSEVEETASYVEQVARSIGLGGVDVHLGIMVETPAAAIMVDRFAETGLIKFVSFGTNDLAQYVLAADRTNERLGNLYRDLDPSVIRLIEMSMSKLSKYKEIEVEVCGELASRQHAIPILLGLGIRRLSVNIHLAALTKHNVARLRMDDVREKLIPKILSSKSPEEVEELVRSYLSSVPQYLLRI